MCLQRIIYSVLKIIIATLIVSCASAPKFALDDIAKSKFTKIPHIVGIEFAGPREGKCWKYDLIKGELLLRDVWSCPPQWIKREPFYIDFPNDVPKGLPTIDGYTYHGPYSISPDNSFIAISLSPNKYGLNCVPVDIALIQFEVKNILLQTKKDDSFIISIAWSFDSNFFAVLESQGKRLYGFKESIYALSGHSIDEFTYHLSIYDRKGNLLVRSKVASGLVGGNARVFWEE